MADIQRDCSRSKLVLKNQSGGLFQPFSGFSCKCLLIISIKNQFVIVIFGIGTVNATKQTATQLEAG
ncbi:hypothetical protein [Methylophilus sp. TWE2]|uniref:hypothetical protein n=1 Tax=Methylophilus sp. TWE2 TaxID=1662285 RepID=UPI0012E02F0F|nr:hypothetical protein [Methylophilus sp. TWE2]